MEVRLVTAVTRGFFSPTCYDCGFAAQFLLQTTGKKNFWHPGYTISCYSRGLRSTKTLNESNRTPFSCNGQHTWLEIPVVVMEKLYPCSFKCLTSVAVMACMWLSPLIFCSFFTSAKSVLSSLFSFSGSFSSILLTVFFF